MAAARLKAQYAVSYGDAFAITLAIELDATVVTNDPEFKNIEHLVKVKWIT
jgi:uncharacterized protein